jgi:hypothetical protein
MKYFKGFQFFGDWAELAFFVPYKAISFVGSFFRLSVSLGGLTC